MLVECRVGHLAQAILGARPSRTCRGDRHTGCKHPHRADGELLGTACRDEPSWCDPEHMLLHVGLLGHDPTAKPRLRPHQRTRTRGLGCLHGCKTSHNGSG